MSTKPGQLQAAPPPIATTLFHLTPRGEELRSVVRALADWGAPLPGESVEGDVFRSDWVRYPAALYLKDTAPKGPPVTIEVRTGDEPMVIEAADGAVRTRPGPPSIPTPLSRDRPGW